MEMMIRMINNKNKECMKALLQKNIECMRLIKMKKTNEIFLPFQHWRVSSSYLNMKFPFTIAIMELTI